MALIMDSIREGRGWQFVAREARPRRALAGIVVGMVVLGSIAFLLGWDFEAGGISVDLPFLRFRLLLWNWMLAALVIGVAAGWVSAGIVPTAASAWLLTLWWHTFPPLVGYSTGEWSANSRYTYPRFTLEAYLSARAELVAALDFSVSSGVVVTVIAAVGIGYVSGRGLRRVSEAR